MPIPGNHLRRVFCRRVEALETALGGLFPAGAPLILRLIAPALPLVAASAFFPRAAPLALGACAILQALLMRPVQASLYDYSQARLQLALVIPFLFLFLAWGFLLAGLNRAEQISHTLGPFMLLTLAGIWPAFQRARRFQAKKKPPYGVLFPLLWAVIMIQQGLIYGG